MTRRQFLSACVVLVAAWITGIGRGSLRYMLERIGRQDYDDMPLGLIDVLTSSSVHGLSTSAYEWNAWTVARPTDAVRLSGLRA